MAVNDLSFLVYLEGLQPRFIGSDEASTVEEAIKIAHDKLNAPATKPVMVEVFKGQSLHEVIRG